jgi:hypothetical protein
LVLKLRKFRVINVESGPSQPPSNFSAKGRKYSGRSRAGWLHQKPLSLAATVADNLDRDDGWLVVLLLAGGLLLLGEVLRRRSGGGGCG